MKLTPERLHEIKQYSQKTIDTWSAMECPKEDMIIDLLFHIEALEAELAFKANTQVTGYCIRCEEMAGKMVGISVLQKVQAERDQLREELKECSLYSGDNEERIFQLEKERDQLDDECAAVSLHRDQLKADNERLSTENEKLVEHCQILAKGYKEAREENEEMRGKLAMAPVMSQIALEQENQRLHERIEKLREAINKVTGNSFGWHTSLIEALDADDLLSKHDSESLLSKDNEEEKG